ncbi:molecular chaperone TorD family protein [Carboxydocella sp. ULO1]|uniref:molecular chaperone TorD family protein n=1 Tax=Carboxydocella sp. ULO1 TaxID=1926599 RepID=UPI0009D01EB3|nr:molecular chaperone TorD family protein [Carboxydocella sp. ULO1]GAW28360.1 Nitrate reductase delta subunit [Carboxydocella sp. ULO1]
MNSEIWFELADALKEPEDWNYRDDYLEAFVHPKTRIIPVESLFRPWSEGEKTELPFARQKGYLLSDRALHMRELLNQYGLEIPPEMQETPDHLIIELEFLGFLLANGKGEEAKAFVGEHLDWVPELVEAARRRLPVDNRYLRVLQEVEAKIKESFV